MKKYKVSATADAGGRPGNQQDVLFLDTFGVSTGEERFEINRNFCEDEKPILCFGVFDGMGGEVNGLEAAIFARVQLEEYVQRLVELNSINKEGIEKLCNNIHTEMQRKYGKQTMGTTATLLFLEPKSGKCKVYNVGDSPALHCICKKNGECKLKTKYKNMRYKKYHFFCQKNELTSAITSQSIIIDVGEYEFTLSQGDKAIICSDGIEVITKKRLENLISANNNAFISQTVVDLIKPIASDNISLVIISRQIDEHDQDQVNLQNIKELETIRPQGVVEVTTNIGPKSLQQDAYVVNSEVGQYNQSTQNYTLEKNAVSCIGVADGVSATTFSKEAAMIICKTIANMICQHRMSLQFSENEISKLMIKTLEQATTEIKKMLADKGLESEPSASTLSTIIINKEKVYFILVGDSPVVTLCKDNTVLTYGFKSKEKNMDNVLDDYLSSAGIIGEIKWHEIEIDKIKKIYIMSDGAIYGMQQSEVEEYFRKGPKTIEAVKNALRKGSNDNITCIEVNLEV